MNDTKVRSLALAFFATDPQVVAYLERNGEAVPVALSTLEKAWKRGLAEKKPEGPWVQQALGRAKAMLGVLAQIDEAKKLKAPRVSGPPTYQNVEGLMPKGVDARLEARDHHGSRLEVGDIVATAMTQISRDFFPGTGKITVISGDKITVNFGIHKNSFLHVPSTTTSLIRRKPASL